ncbi:quinolinate synthase NadA [bacterium]|nr:quinolinate synthase NadA [bacterium]
MSLIEDREIIDEIKALKAKWGSELMILGHHYQRHGIVSIADEIGDSFGLAKAAAEAPGVKHIVFCGVRFMAESAAILCRDDQRVLHPEPEAGCPMADMAPMEAVLEAWKILNARNDLDGRTLVPVTYMNSHAPLKGFTGENNGLVCTSSNAEKALSWAWSQGDIAFFFPDQHLGRNTGKAMGLKPEEMVVWYPSKANGGIESLDGVKMILWNGHCPVHMKFKARDVNFIRKHFPGSLIAVHPECEQEVVDLADAVGSTAYLEKYVKGLPKGSRVFVGTEVNMVERLNKECPDVKVELLFRSLCPTMYMVDMHKVLRTLRNLETEEPVPMPASIKAPARLALERMLALQK